MISRRTKLMFLVVMASFGTLALGQDWPKPASTPRTEVLCNTSGCVSELEGKKIVGYSGPITTFVGRYVDSTSTGVNDTAFTFQPVRAKEMRIAPDRNRIFFMAGSAMAMYDIDTFFTRLEGNEARVAPNAIGLKVSPRARSEQFLRFDRYFYPKNGQPAEEFIETNAGDGEDKLFDYDWDDRGYVYMACGPYSWGITKDDGGKGPDNIRLNRVYQRTNRGSTDVLDPNRIALVKLGAEYYVVVLDAQGGTARSAIVNVWNVTNPAVPVHYKSQLFPNGASGGFSAHVRNTEGTRFATIGKQKQIDIFTGQALVNLENPLITFSGEYLGITTDGTNFYATSKNPSSNAVILSIISPSGGTYTKIDYTMEAKFSAGGGPISYGAGYLTISTFERERGLQGTFNLWLYKVNGLAKPTEIPIDMWTGSEGKDYVAKFYGQAAPPGYVSPGNWSFLRGAHVVKRGARYFLIIEAFGLGDVYEIKGADAIDGRVKKHGKERNDNSKAPPNSGPFYGDEITFTSEYTGTTAPSVTWDFGDNVVQTAPASTPDITHQYGGLIASDLPKTRTVKATNAGDSAMKDTFTLTLAKPQVRVGLLDSTTLFTQATTDYTLPIVSSDVFTDASDGAVESHYAAWNIDSVIVNRKPNETQGVGAIGKRTLIFGGHYGPYTAASTITPGSSDALFSINPIKYEVRPFAAGITGPLSCTGQNCGTSVGGDGVGFRSGTRVTKTAGDLTGTTNALVNYKWELLKPGTGGLVDAGHSATGQKKISEIPDFIVPRSAFQNAVDWKARLTLTLVTLSAVLDPQYAVSTVDSVPLLGPTTSEIRKEGCGNVGAPCVFNTPSTRADIDPATWTYLWEVIDRPVGVPAIATAVTPTYSPKFTTMGSYTVRVKVSNAIGDATLTYLVPSVGAPLCSSAPTNANIAISYKGATSGCASGSNCSVNENVAFGFQPFQWTPGDCDKYEWDFGDGTAKSTEKEPTHAFNRTGSFTVVLKIDGGVSDGQVSRVITVGNTTPDPGPGPGPDPTPTCTQMVANANVFISMSGSVSPTCTMTTGAACSTDDTITFDVKQFGYNFSCATHTFTWNFNDGTGTHTGRLLTHKFANAGTYAVSVRVRHSGQDLTVPGPSTIKVSGSGDNPTTCPTMVANGNIFIGLNGPESGCTAVTGKCKPAEAIAFRAATFNYSYGCAPHTFEWNFGDNQTSTQQDPTHAYAAAGSYKVSLKVTRSGTSVTMNQTVVVGDPPPACPKMQPELNVFTTFVGAKTRCTSSGGSCEEEEEIAFNVNAFNYPFTCATHTFEWAFGDGATATGQSPTHTYTRPGTFPVTVKVKNGQEEVTLHDVVTVAPDGPTRRRGVRK